MAQYSDEYHGRSEEFGRAYEDFETTGLINLIVAAGDFLERLTWEPEAVDAAMRTLYQAITNDAPNPDRPWRDIWEDAWSELGIIKSSDYFVGLNAYAYYGLRPGFLALPEGETAGKQEVGKMIADGVQKGRDLLSIVPANWADVQELERTVLAAEARIALDFGHDVSVEQLAALSQMSAKSIRNLLTPKSGEEDLRLNQDGAISTADVLRWLKKRPDFKPSVWWAAQCSVTAIVTPNTEMLGEVVFVPVAKDGTWFHPALCRNGRGYTIGSKGAEMPVNDYFEALGLLTRATTPQWRRPNPAGNWGIVSGVAWQRKDLTELKKALEDGDAK